MSDYLPPEVMMEIMMRVPVDTLLRFRCVCKSWYSLITSPAFISQHFNRKISNNDTHLLVSYCPGFYYLTFSIHLDNPTFDVHAKFDIPLTKKIKYFRIIDVCLGLVLFYDDDDRDMLFWNPSIRKALKLPKPKLPHLRCKHSIGFGFTPKTNDYKIVFIQHIKKAPFKAEVYELSTGCWRDIEAAYLSYVMYDREPQACLNGVVHWVGYNPIVVETSSRDMIVSFDFETEVFRSMRLPNGLHQKQKGNLSAPIFPNSNSLRVATFGASLSLMQIIRSNADQCCCIWVMKDYGVAESWTKELTVNLGFSTRFLGFRMNGDVLLEKKFRTLVSYNPLNNQMKNLGINGYYRSFYTATFVDSLVLLGRLNRALNRDEYMGDLASCMAVHFEDQIKRKDGTKRKRKKKKKG